ncbi:MAG: hypothetical protein Tsb0016_24940 [Sphingomonadales bacterium]
MILDIPTVVQVNHTLDDQARQTVLFLWRADRRGYAGGDPESQAVSRALDESAKSGYDYFMFKRRKKDLLNDDSPVAPGYDAWFRREVRAGQREAARGDLIEHEEVVRMLDETLSHHVDKARGKKS